MKLDMTNALILFGVGFVGFQLVGGSSAHAKTRPIVPPDTPEAGGSGPRPASGSTSSRSVYPIQRGSRGAEVAQLQAYLGIPVDGVFGSDTENALVQRTGSTKITSAEGLRRLLGGELSRNPSTGATVYTPGGATPTTPSAPVSPPPAPAYPAPAPRPALPATPSTTEAYNAKYGSFPLKVGSKGQYVRNLQQWLGVNIDGSFGSGTQAALKTRTGKTQITTFAELEALRRGSGGPSAPAPASPAPATTGSAIPSSAWPELNRVWRAIWEPVTPPNVWKLRATMDKPLIVSVLKAKTDAQLRLFIQQYNAAYKNNKGLGASAALIRKTPTLYADLATANAGIVGFSAVRDRVKKLS